jgi:hypothetical protein
VLIEQVLTDRRSDIVSRWQSGVALADGKRTLGLRGAHADPFGNPVRWIWTEAIEDIYSQLCQRPAVQASPATERLMRLAALRGPDVSQAVSFLDYLTTLLKTELAQHPASPELLSALDCRIQAFKQLATELFEASRQLLQNLRTRETQWRTAAFAARVGRQRRERNLDRCHL